MQVLKFLRRIHMVLVVLSMRVNADRGISCDGHDFECEGAYHYVTCILLADGQRLYKPNQCDPGTVCNRDNLPSAPCDFISVPSSTISTAPTSTADRATTLREASTLPYVRPTSLPTLLDEHSSSKAIAHQNSIESYSSNDTLPESQDSLKVSFGVNIAGNMETMNNTSTNVSTAMSLESPSTIKTSAKMVFDKAEISNQTNWQGPILGTNTTIQNLRKLTRISINTLMEAVFRFPMQQTQNVVTYSNMRVKGANSSSFSVNVATDVAGTDLNSNQVAITTNTTVSFDDEAQNESVLQISEKTAENSNTFLHNSSGTLPKPKASCCPKCNSTKCTCMSSSSNHGNILPFHGSIHATHAVEEDAVKIILGGLSHDHHTVISLKNDSSGGSPKTGELNDQLPLKSASAPNKSHANLSTKKVDDRLQLNISKISDSLKLHETTTSAAKELPSEATLYAVNGENATFSDQFQVDEKEFAPVDASYISDVILGATNSSSDVMQKNSTIDESVKVEALSEDTKGLLSVEKINIPLSKASHAYDSTTSVSKPNATIASSNSTRTSKPSASQKEPYLQANILNTTHSDADMEHSNVAHINQPPVYISTTQQNYSTIDDFRITNISTPLTHPLNSSAYGSVVEMSLHEDSGYILNDTILDSFHRSGNVSVLLATAPNNVTSNNDSTKASNELILTTSGHNFTQSVTESLLGQTPDANYGLNFNFSENINDIKNLTISEPQVSKGKMLTDSSQIHTNLDSGALETNTTDNTQSNHTDYAQDKEKLNQEVASANINMSSDPNNAAHSAEVQNLTSKDKFSNTASRDLINSSYTTDEPPLSTFDANPTTASAEKLMSQNYVSLEAEEEGETTTLATILLSSDAGIFTSTENFTDSYSTPKYGIIERSTMLFEFRTPATILATTVFESGNETSLTGDDPLRYSLGNITQHTDINVGQDIHDDLLSTGLANDSSSRFLPFKDNAANQNTPSTQSIPSYAKFSSQSLDTTTQRYTDSTSPDELFWESTTVELEHGMSHHNKRLAMNAEDTKVIATKDKAKEKMGKTLQGSTISPNWPDLDLMKPHPVISETTFLQSEENGGPSKNGEGSIIGHSFSLLDVNRTDGSQLSKSQQSFASDSYNSLRMPVDTFSAVNNVSSTTRLTEEASDIQELPAVESATLNTQTAAENTSPSLVNNGYVLSDSIGQSIQENATGIVEPALEATDTGRSEIISLSIPTEVMAHEANVVPEDTLSTRLSIRNLTLEQTDTAISNVTTKNLKENVEFNFSSRLPSSESPPIDEVASANQSITVFVEPSRTVLTNESVDGFSSGQTRNDSDLSVIQQNILSTTTESLVISSGSSQSSTASLTRTSINETSNSTHFNVSAEQASLASADTKDPAKEKESFTCTNHGVYPDKLDCKKYHLCVRQGIGYVKITGSCSPTSAFNPETQRCVSDVSICYKKKCLADGNFADPLNDMYYFSCKEIRPGVFHMYHLQCDASLKFIPEKRKCDIPVKLSEDVGNAKSTSHGRFNVANTEGTLRNSSYTEMVLIEPEFKEMQATTTAYETAFIESIPVNDPSYFRSGRQDQSIHNESNTESSMRAIRSTPSFECDQDGIFANPIQCTQFYMCVKGATNDFTKILRECPRRYAFHEKSKSCSRDLSVCPQLWCKGHGNFPHPNDDSSYYRCVPNAGGGFRIYEIKCEHSMKFVPSEGACLKDEQIGESFVSSTLPLAANDVNTHSAASKDELDFGKLTKEATTESTNNDPVNFRPHEEHLQPVVSESYRKEAEKRLRGILNEMRDKASRQHQAESESNRSDEKGQQNSNSSSEEATRTTKKETFVCQDAGRFADSLDCRKYFICSQKKDELILHHLECRGKDRFDAKKRICVDEEDAHCV